MWGMLHVYVYVYVYVTASGEGAEARYPGLAAHNDLCASA